MECTGERLVPGIPRLETMIVEELARLNFVQAHFLGKTVLDAGCGLGHATYFLANNGAKWTLGVDICQEAVLSAHENNQTKSTFGVMDCNALALKNDCFDVVVSLDFIEHIPDPDRYLKEVRRILTPLGTFFMSTPNKKISSKSDGKASWAFHEREFSLDELEKILSAYFKHVEIWGAFVPIYEQHPIRRVTKSPLSQVKHFLPAKLRLWVSSSIRLWIKPNLRFDDVEFTKTRPAIENAPTFIALCSQKPFI